MCDYYDFSDEDFEYEFLEDYETINTENICDICRNRFSFPICKNNSDITQKDNNIVECMNYEYDSICC